MFGSHKVNSFLKHPGYNLGTVGAVVGIASGVSGLLGGGGGGGDSSGQQAAGMADPFGRYRGQYAQQLNQFMADPTGYTKASPGYQFNYKQGLDALQRQFAAGGMSASGNALLGAEKYGQDYAMQQGNNIFNQLAQLSGANWQSGPNAANAMLAQQNQQYGMQQGAAQGLQGAFSGFADSPGGAWVSKLFNPSATPPAPVDMTGFMSSPSYGGGGSSQGLFDWGGGGFGGV